MEGSPSLDRLRSVARETLSAVGGVAAVYAYGSRVRGRPFSFSDLDLALVMEEDEGSGNPLVAEEAAARLESALGGEIEVDAHVAADLPLAVLGRVVTEGELIYERDRVRRVRFESATRLRYFDFLPLLERDAREGLAADG